jgi:hypothetical protein
MAEKSRHESMFAENAVVIGRCVAASWGSAAVGGQQHQQGRDGEYPGDDPESIALSFGESLTLRTYR